MTSIRPFDRFAAMRVLAASVLCIAAGVATAAETALRTVQVRIANHPLKVEVAQREADRQKGLMFREKIAKNDGMLFIFDEPAYHSMWMKNTLIPLSVAFVDAGGTILNILDMEPGSLESHMSAGPSIYAIETNQGWFAEKGLKAGDKVTGLPKLVRNN
ncbi:MAG TPA: DUF192 domain-containing protein [Usitatibacter sp.]|nr:DUF192 domain-containing protein [Usitatibacter sp.]